MITLCVTILLIVATLCPVSAETLTKDTVWHGEVEVTEDLLVPAGVTLTVMPQTVVRVWPTESTKIDPEYLSHRTEITVRGTLQINGTENATVVFQSGSTKEDDRWAGIIVDGGRVECRFSEVSGAETALYVIAGSAHLNRTRLSGNRYGLIGQGEKNTISLKNVNIEKNEYGLFLFEGAAVERDEVIIERNSRKDFFESATAMVAPVTQTFHYLSRDISRIYGDDSLPGETLWKGRIRIQGLVRVPPEGRLIIYPGTIIEFSKKDTNKDGIGENGLMIQGVLVAKGTAAEPIVFRSAEDDKSPGDWDAINILGSDAAQNLIEFCRIENAYRGLHFHFSNVMINHGVLRQNYRGAQFQESLVEIKSSRFFENRSALQARDSEVVFRDNIIANNLNGANFFRLNLKASGNSFIHNSWDGLRIREGATEIEKNIMRGNRFGLIMSDAVFGKISGNIVQRNLEAGITCRDTENVEIKGNIIGANGLNGINLNNVRSLISGNLIADNGERGIGIASFSGAIRQNNIVANGLYAIGLDDEKEAIDAAMNWWGESDLDQEIYDLHDNASLGEVLYEPRAQTPVMVEWPLPLVSSDISWNGAMLVSETVTVSPGTTLSLTPGTTVLFADNSGMAVDGRILADGTAKKRVTFSSLSKHGPSDWQEILLNKASGSRFVYCDFEFADWGIHSHFSELTIDHCRFRHNDGGVRFRSGPLEIRNSLFSNNRIGLRAFRGNATIHDNVFTNNEIGLFVREKGGGLTIYRNNIFANERYNMRLGDFNKENVDARENWWGSDNPLLTVYDGHNEEYIGKVILDPYLKKPLEIITE